MNPTCPSGEGLDRKVSILQFFMFMTVGFQLVCM